MTCFFYDLPMKLTSILFHVKHLIFARVRSVELKAIFNKLARIIIELDITLASVMVNQSSNIIDKIQSTLQNG